MTLQQAGSSTTPTTREFSTHGSLSSRTLRVGVLNNPLSRRNERDLKAIQNLLKEFPEVLKCEAHSAKDIYAAVQDLQRKNVEIIVINGGDGTVQAALTALFQNKRLPLPLLAILPSGTSNLIASDVGLERNRKKALRTLLAWSRGEGGQPVILERHVLRMERAPGQDPIYGMLFGAGALYQGALISRRLENRLGRFAELGQALTLGHFFLSLALRRNHALTSIPITVSRDNGPSTHQKYLVLLVTTLERLFLGLHPYWGMEPKPLHFTAVGAYPQHFLRTVPSLLFGRRPKYGTSAHGYFSHNVQEIQLNFESGFNMDGELSMPDPKLGPVRLSDGGVISFIRF